VISAVGFRTISLFVARIPLSGIFAFAAFLVAIAAALIPVLGKF
jgi:hypothetical protein